MARFLLSLPPEEFDQFKKQNLHVIPRGALGKLTKEETAQARERGLVFRQDDYETHSGKPIDEMQLEDHSCDGYTSIDEPEPDSPAEPAEPGGKTSYVATLAQDEQTWFVVRQVLNVIISAPNARLEAECFRLSSGLADLDNITMTSLAEKHGLTRAAISKRCNRQLMLLNMKPSQFQRPMNVRKTYKDARMKVLARERAKWQGE